MSSKHDAKDVVFCKVDVDVCAAVAQTEGVRSMPTFRIYKKGAAVSTLAGWQPGKIEEVIKKSE
jgi:thioredoxin-like negative regulator of GroEL